MSDFDPNSRVCIVCGRVLDYWEGQGWRHSFATQDPTETDHPPIAVRPDEAGEQARPRCDFCYSDDVNFTIPARSFTLPGQISSSVGDWAACESCAQAIEKDAWNVLMRRVTASWEARHGPMSDRVAQDLRAMYRTLRKHITGPVRPNTR